MIEITSGTLEEQIIKILQKTYPIAVSDIKEKTHISRAVIIRTLQKLQTKGIVQLEPLPNKIYVRLLRRDFRFIGKRRQQKFVKHYSEKKKQEPEEYDGIMFS